jgi:flagellar L-ring protein FlgH
MLSGFLHRKIFTMSFILAMLFGCSTHGKPIPNDPNYAPVMVPQSATPPAYNGSLYRASNNIQLFADRKATQVGDILTVVLSENTVSKKTSKVGVKKDAKISVPDATVLGSPVGIGTDISGKRDFAGDANAAQSNNLAGDVAVSVIDVWPNGTLVVRGEKWLTLNRGDEFIRISGLVRPDDVKPDNTVLSTKVANARITYSGTGALADSQTVGWLSRFFNSAYWPF